MESLILIAALGAASTLLLLALALWAKARPYALGVLAVSLAAALAVREQAIGPERDMLAYWAMYLAIAFGAQLLASPIALVAWWLARRRARPSTQ